MPGLLLNQSSFKNQDNMKNWEDISAESELLALQEIKKSFDSGDLTDAEEGLTILIESMSRSDRRALENQLIRLMLHVIKWKIQPDKRSRSWANSIRNARYEIKSWKKYSPALNDDFLRKIWQESLEEALSEAEIETGATTHHITGLTWEDVFETPYLIK
jgi:hypothetical protein